jgi:hypothetical protein
MGIFNSFFALGSREFIIQQFANGCLVIGFSYGCGSNLLGNFKPPHQLLHLPKVGADHEGHDLKQLQGAS